MSIGLSSANPTKELIALAAELDRLYDTPLTNSLTEMVRSAVPHPSSIETMVNCANCGRILNAEICVGDSAHAPFSKQVLITVERCGCEDHGRGRYRLSADREQTA